jgi:hypothetical protein
MCPWAQVVGVDASWVVAIVADHLPVWDVLLIRQNPRQPMCSNRDGFAPLGGRTSYVADTIACVVGASRPLPTKRVIQWRDVPGETRDVLRVYSNALNLNGYALTNIKKPNAAFVWHKAAPLLGVTAPTWRVQSQTIAHTGSGGQGQMAKINPVEVVVNVDLEKLKQLSAEAKAGKLTWAEIEARLWDGEIIKITPTNEELKKKWPQHLA